MVDVDRAWLIFGHMKRIQKNSGFTLLELLIVLVLVGVLTTMAMPSYQSHMRTVWRHEAELALFEASGRLEHYAAEQGSYADASLSALHIQTLTPSKRYRLYLNVDSSGTHYHLSAQPIDFTNGVVEMKG